MDTVDTRTRSKIMAAVGQKNTGPETLLRSALHKRGFRYRLHDRSLPGSPDLVFPRFRAVIFVHGCYWHYHGCYRSTVPKTRHDFWANKFEANRKRDYRKTQLLLDSGWRVLVVWECALVGKTARPISVVAHAVKNWLASMKASAEISGEPVIVSAPVDCELLRMEGCLAAFDAGTEPLQPRIKFKRRNEEGLSVNSAEQCKNA